MSTDLNVSRVRTLDAAWWFLAYDTSIEAADYRDEFSKAKGHLELGGQVDDFTAHALTDAAMVLKGVR